MGPEYEKLFTRPKPGPSLYRYSIAMDQATTLQLDDFINFGIPRAQYREILPSSERVPSSESTSWKYHT